MSRPTLYGAAMTSAERQRRHRAKRQSGVLTVSQAANGESSESTSADSSWALESNPTPEDVAAAVARPAHDLLQLDAESLQR